MGLTQGQCFSNPDGSVTVPVDSVSNSDGTLTISPTTGDVIASLNLSQANTWAALQTFGNNISIGGATLNVSSLTTSDILQYNGTNWINVAETTLPYAANAFTTINAPAGTDPVADSATDTLNLATGDSSITVTGTSGTDTVDFAINLSNANTWGAVQTFGNNISIGGGTFNLSALDDDEIIYFNGSQWTNRLELSQNNIPDLNTLDTGLTSTGAVIFLDASNDLEADTTNFHYDDTNNRLGVGVNSSLTAKITAEAAATELTNIKSDGSTNAYTSPGTSTMYGILNTKTTSGLVSVGAVKTLYGINSTASQTHSTGSSGVLDAYNTYGAQITSAASMVHALGGLVTTEATYGIDVNATRSGTLTFSDFLWDAGDQYGVKITSGFQPVLNNAAIDTASTFFNHGVHITAFSTPTITSGNMDDVRTYGITVDLSGNTQGTLNYAFGLNINSMTTVAGGLDGAWGVYVLADVDNYFKRAIGINQGSPTARLHIVAPDDNDSGLDSPAMFVDGATNAFDSDAASDLAHLYRTIGDGGRFKTHKTLDVRLDVNESLNATTSASIDRIGISTTIDNDTTYGSSFVQSAGTEDFIGHLISLDSEGTVTAAGDFDQRHFGIDLIVNDEQTWNNNAGSYNSTIYGARINTSHSGTVTAADSLIRLSYGVYIDCGVSASALDSATSYGLYINDVEGDTRWGIYDNSAENWYMNGDFGIGTTAPADKVHIFDDKNSNIAPSAAGLMVSDTGTMAAGVGGGIVFRGKYTSGGAETTAASIHAMKTNGTSGNYSWDLSFVTRKSGGSYSETMRCTDGKDLAIGMTTANARLQVANDSTDGRELVNLSQSDGDKPFINFVGTASANTTDSISTHGTSGATTDHIQIELNGTKAWIAVSTNDPSA